MRALLSECGGAPQIAIVLALAAISFFFLPEKYFHAAGTTRDQRISGKTKNAFTLYCIRGAALPALQLSDRQETTTTTSSQVFSRVKTNFAVGVHIACNILER